MPIWVEISIHICTLFRHIELLCIIDSILCKLKIESSIFLIKKHFFMCILIVKYKYICVIYAISLYLIGNYIKKLSLILTDTFFANKNTLKHFV